MNLAHTDTPTIEDYATVYVAFELSKAKWKLGVMLPGSEKLSRDPDTEVAQEGLRAMRNLQARL